MDKQYKQIRAKALNKKLVEMLNESKQFEKASISAEASAYARGRIEICEFVINEMLRW